MLCDASEAVAGSARRQRISSHPLLDTACDHEPPHQSIRVRDDDRARPYALCKAEHHAILMLRELVSCPANLSRRPNEIDSLDGSLSIQPHGGITLTARMRAYRQASRRVTSHLLRSAATVASVHGGPDRTHVGRARNESGYRLSYENLEAAVTPDITLGGYPDARPKPPVSSWARLHGTRGRARRRACRGLGSF
jgi:hypothetical protein